MAGAKVVSNLNSWKILVVDVDFVICLGYFLLRIFLPHLMSHDMHHRGIIGGNLE